LALWSLKAAGSRFHVFFHHSSYLDVLCAEAREKGFIDPTPIKRGVTVRGGWPEVWRANLELRGANRVLARVATFSKRADSQ
jgi:putative N6-adenine-specific DNA methylase